MYLSPRLYSGFDIDDQLTCLDVGLLGLVGQDLVQLLLVGIIKLGKLHLSLGIHFFWNMVWLQ